MEETKEAVKACLYQCRNQTPRVMISTRSIKLHCVGISNIKADAILERSATSLTGKMS